jgi:hypothetical protein
MEIGVITVGLRLAWRPLTDIPDDAHDGRDIILWRSGPIVASWCDGWRDAVGRTVVGATHYADVEGPVL